MTEKSNSPLEQAIHYFHRHREIYELQGNYTAEEIAAFEEEFESWIAAAANQKAYAEASQTWHASELMTTVTDEELEVRGITLVNRKAELKRKVKLIGILAIADLLLSFIFPPLSILEPVLLLALIYFGIQYWREPALEEEKVRDGDRSSN